MKIYLQTLLRQRLLLLASALLFFPVVSFSQGAVLATPVDEEWIQLYQQLHAAPELSGQEKATSAVVAVQLRSAGFTVTEHLGKFTDRPWKGYGVVGVLRNQEGPVLMLRSEMDALPLLEKTGASFASTVKVKSESGEEVPVMHACGHDLHLTVLLATARYMASHRQNWKGTLVIVAQPSEEGGPGASGAKALLEDSLWSRFPNPNFILALHQNPEIPAGKVGMVSGYATATSATGEITVKGVGGHPAKPHLYKDPILLASQIVVGLQNIVSRDVNPLVPSTITLGAIHGGTVANVIPEQVVIKYAVRSLEEETCDRMIDAVKRIARGTGITAGLPEPLLPVVTAVKGYPSVYNDPLLADRVGKLFQKTFGPENFLMLQPGLTGEDFSYYGRSYQCPTLFFQLGGSDPDRLQESKLSGKSLPSNHSPFMLPAYEKGIATGIRAMTAAATELLSRSKQK